MKTIRVHEILNFLFGDIKFNENLNNSNKELAIQHGIMMHDYIQNRFEQYGFKKEVVIEKSFPKYDIILQGHIDLLKVTPRYYIIYEIKPLISWFKEQRRYTYQANFYKYLVNEVLNDTNKKIKTMFILYYKRSFRKVPLAFYLNKTYLEFLVKKYVEHLNNQQ